LSFEQPFAGGLNISPHFSTTEDAENAVNAGGKDKRFQASIPMHKLRYEPRNPNLIGNMLSNLQASCGNNALKTQA